MLRSLVGLLTTAVLIVGALLLAGTRPAAGDVDTAPEIAPTTSASTTTATTTAGAAPTTTTATPTTTTATPATTTTMPAATAATRPAASVVASNSMVGVGGTVDFAGTCDGSDFGSVVANITGIATVVVDTGLTGSSWNYRWTAPADPLLISSFDFEFWCGDPADAPDVRFPESLVRRVDMVASQPPPSPSPSPSPAVDPAQVILPETS